MAAVFFPLPQDALRDPEKWNSDWEALLRRQVAFPGGLHFLFRNQVRQIEASPRDGLGGSLASYPVLVSSTCAIQRNITEEALGHFTHDDFETKWMNAGADVRRVHILAALADVCSKARNLNEARGYCPELGLTRLRLDGKVFLNLLKSVMLEDASFIPSQPIFVSHPGWDSWAEAQRKLNDSEVKKIVLEEMLILRTKLICHVVQFTLRSFFREDPPRLFVQKEHKSIEKSPRPPIPSEMAALLGPRAAKARFKDEIAGMKARHSQRLNSCSYMGCTKAEPPDGSVKFSRCQPCFDQMQRQVLYCSRTCQKAHWKLRHKTICGKTLDFETVSRPVEHPVSAPTSEMRIGPPVNGYKRSLALTAQVTALNLHPHVDYQLYKANNEPVYVDFGAGQYPQIFFRAHRQIAMTEGDRACVAAMAHYLCLVFMSNLVKEELREITPNMIVAQLAREFDYENLRDDVLALQQGQNEDPLRRPPLLFDAPPDLWANLNKDVNLSEIVVTLD
ncbi:hypothetical protein K438DRAFT_2025190 [Mycena galopus ATCC 62051]|nr:hypothetical protein K438DRAFT_2025190 [Mycena galopus ATCC 62051]